MPKICIIGAMNIKHMSLISLYTSIFDKNNIAYDIIYLDRYNVDELSNAKNMYKFEITIKREWSKLKKLLSYYKFSLFAKKIIRKNNYELLITWQTFTAYLLLDTILLKYKKKHIMNVRDYIIEDKWFIKPIIKCLIKSSVFCALSSDAFVSFLPRNNYVIVNSINYDILKIKPSVLSTSTTIKIGFVGNCRYLKENIKLINSLKNDARFELWYCGTNSDIFKEYAERNSIYNLKTMGDFEMDDTINIMSEMHIINSVFGSNGLDNKTLVPIRLFTSAFLGKPILVSSNTHVSKLVLKHKVGFVIDVYEDLADTLYDFYMSLNLEDFRRDANSFFNKSNEQNIEFNNILLNFTEKYRGNL